ncbi:MAG: FHA domain-containing protein [Candidatus Aminicenantes bacterium]|nr:MAG: FHA domain-containing protein [Candidatus Aminicenantes bacterium]
MKKNKPSLQITESDGRSHELVMTGEEVTIGRSDENVLTFIDPKVSRNHAKIAKKGNNYVLTDLGSFNGTKVNTEFVTNKVLSNGDEIRIGGALLIFLSGKDGISTTDDKLDYFKDDEYQQWQQQTISIKPQDCTQIDSRTLLVTPKAKPRPKDRGKSMIPRKDRQPTKDQFELSRLERMNKVLFVLYEISRHINIIHDFNELLGKIMELIFQVIDADYGFLILMDDKSGRDFVPVVVKLKDDRMKGKIRASRTLCKKVIEDRVALLTSNAMDDARFSPTESLVKQKIRSAICVPLWQKEKIIGAIQLDSTRLGNQFTQDDLELLKAIGCQMSMVLEQANLNKKIREEEELRSRLERYHSPQVVNMILKTAERSQDDLLEAKDVSVTILFSDIVGFTRLSERLNPLDVNMLLNQYFSRMTDIIFEYEGTLDKYVGDRMMAVFGAPLEKDDHAERAIRAALKMRKELAEMMEQASPDKKFDVRLGLNTGHVVAGNIGSPKRMDYTVIGDSVNIASRLESSAEPNQILIGEETYRQVKGKFKTRKVGSKTFRGKSESIMVYEVLD